jgi:transmembrane sensor
MIHSEGFQERWRERDVSDDVAGQAQAWVSLLLSGQATQADGRALSAWRNADERHEAAFRKAARLHGLVRQAAGELRAEKATAAPGASASTRPSRRRFLVGGAVAASAAGVAVMLGRAGVGVRAADFETAKGEVRTVQLAKGVSAELNTLTRIARREDIGAGAFELLAGEALVSIEQDEAVSIFAGDGETVASRARLSLRCLDGQVRVSCLDGAARVRSAGRTIDLPGRYSVTYDQASLAAPAPIDPATEGAWRRGLLVFRDEPLGAVIEEINRYREGRIVIASASLRERRVNGTFQTDRIDQVVDQLRLAYGVSATSLPGGVVVVA